MSVFFTSMEDVSMEPRQVSAAAYEKSASAPTTPTEATRLQAHGAALSSALKRRSKGHRVNFPTDDCIVTGYVEPPNPWSNALAIPTGTDGANGQRSPGIGARRFAMFLGIDGFKVASVVP
ncbi:hypothetical protein HPB51_013661 [Rhipicephalus microplus]|uniref:Uncharacterized protein n=1 Tax=Rhipicephalus microplus TaxID=6941 RepID=A0A9J6E1X4_RHIMP|nr:hypothetical protein HPB51_013661 [Rhipicephalus microplus]